MKKRISMWALLSLMTCAVVAAETSYRFERLWPTLAQPWYFNSPAGLACDASGNVYVADSFNGRVQKYTAQGQFITMWTGLTGGGDAFDMPQDVAVDMDGNVYVLDSAACRVRVFTALGREIAAWGGPGADMGAFASPQGIAVNARGRVHVADTGNHRIQIFDGVGNWLGVLGADAEPPLALSEPHALCFDGADATYIADTGNDRIVVVDGDGAYVDAWADEDAFNRPTRVLADGAGHIFVSDTGNFRIRKFTTAGVHVLDWGREGRGAGEFAHLDGLALNNFGHVLAADRGWHDRIQVFTGTGVFISAWGSQRGGRNEFDGPTDVVVNEDLHVYVADFGNSRIQRLSATGQFMEYWGPDADAPGYCRFPYSLALDSMHKLAYAYDMYDHHIRQYDLDGAFIQEWDSQFDDPEAFKYIAGLVAAAGRLYMADSANHRIRVFTQDGALLDDWGAFGFAPGQFLSPYAAAVEADTGLVYVADAYNHRIQVLGEGGVYVRGWGSEGTGPGQFNLPTAVAFAADGSVLVTDSDNHRVQQFTPEGDFIAAFGGPGAAPGQFNAPTGLAALGPDRVLVADTLNNRLQQFRAIEQASRARAIIVAGGGPMPGNTLWDATRLCAHYAYHVLRHLGYAKEDIYLLSDDGDVDLDNDGEANNVADDCTLAALEYGLTEWVDDTELLVVYLVDHGGVNTFRMNETEILEASQLARWLRAARDKVSGTMVVINDSCHSGSFISTLAEEEIKPAPVVIASAMTDQSAYFLGTGTVSFSSIFWTELLNGLDLDGAFRFAASSIQDIYTLQTPQLDSVGDGAANTAADYHAASGVHLGLGGASAALRPVINTVAIPDALDGAEPLVITATDIQSADDVAQVWAVVRPPGVDPAQQGTPMLWLPTVSLDPDGDVYRGAYHDFASPGNYQVAVYARDTAGRASAPVTHAVSVDNPLRSRAVIVAAAAPGTPFWAATVKNTLLAYQALQFQGYSDTDIMFYCAETIEPGVDGLPTIDNLRDAITRWAAEDTRDLLVYLTGVGAWERVELGAGETLFAIQLRDWLDSLQDTLPGRVVVVCDFCASGSFLPVLAGVPNGRRIVISGSGPEGAPSFNTAGDVSFSRFFWRQVLAGANLRAAFLHARNALRFADVARAPCLDDTGDGLYDPGRDGAAAAATVLGMGLQFAADPPVISAVSPPLVLGDAKSKETTSVEIWADGISSTAGVASVFALVTPPGYDPRDCGVSGEVEHALMLEQDADGRYVIVYPGFTDQGVYHVRVHALDEHDQVSMPAETHVEQRSGEVEPDPYEPDDTPETAAWIGLGGEPQRRNFSHPHDEDWARFFAAEDQMVVVETRHLGPAANTRIELYREEGLVLIESDENSNPDQMWASIIQWRADAEGFYLVRVTNIPPERYGADTFYDLIVRDDTGAVIAGAIAVTVRDADTNAALGGARVALSGFGGLAATTTSQGAAVFPALPVNTYTVVATRADYQSTSRTAIVNSAQTTALTLTLQRTPVAEGEDAPPPEGEPPDEGESVPEGEGESADEGESMAEGEGESTAEGELDDEGEDGESDANGCCRAPSQDTSAKTTLFRLFEDWLLFGLSLLVLAAFMRTSKT